MSQYQNILLQLGHPHLLDQVSPSGIPAHRKHHLRETIIRSFFLFFDAGQKIR